MFSIKSQNLDMPQWKSGGSGLCDFETEIRVYRFFIPSFLSDIPTYFQLLNDAEKERANKYIHQKDSQRFIIARAMLKILTGHFLSIPTAMIEIGIGKNKKPFINSNSSTQLDYNISHSGNWIVMAFGVGPIGVDVEHIQTSFNFEPLLPACFSMEEQNFIQTNSNSRELFYRLWTRKESFVKASSRGLDDTLPQLICLDGEWELLSHFSMGQSWNVLSFSLDQEHIASLSFVDGNKNILFIEQDIAI